MTICRTDIEKAIDGIIFDEQGMKFQGLAVVLAKLKFPELIASERHNDLGLDAYVPASLAHDGIGKALACSATATLEKIEGDIQRFRGYVDDVGILLFATPRKVTKDHENKWAQEIKKTYGIRLIILPREDIITDLMKPQNISLCRAHLNINVFVEPTVEEAVAKARDATSELLKGWLKDLRLANVPKIELRSIRVDDNGHDGGQYNLQSVVESLKEGRRIILEAPAGRGKTTTLIQLVERTGHVCFLLNLPDWVGSEKDILSYISATPQFISRDLNTRFLSEIYNAVPCSFLLNGWNEVSTVHSEKAVHALAELERNFPKAGIIVATRTHHIKPALPGSFRLRLLPLNRNQRREYIKEALSSQTQDIIFQLENDPILDDLTRTPLILREVLSIFLSGSPIPRTKSGILNAVVRLIEDSDEHRDHFVREPLMGNASEYLAALAMVMTENSGVTIDESFARNIVSSVSKKLQSDGQITILPQPADILSVLCSHHILERLDYPSNAFKFQHQQFQEWYVSTILRKSLAERIRNQDQNLNRNFVRSYINIPTWEESLRMVAENTEDIRIPQLLVELALDVDPVFAAELARISGESLWKLTGNRVGDRLRSWYQVDDKSHRRCALAGMIASGSDDFRDILIPLLTSQDQQIRLGTYRSFAYFQPSTLGGNWKAVVKEWQVEHRANFVSEIVRGPYMVGIAEEFALNDPDFKVRAAALRSLEWLSVEEALDRILSSYNDEMLSEVLENAVLQEIPPKIWPRARSIYEKILQSAEAVEDRLKIKLILSEISEHYAIDELKHELSQWPIERIKEGRARLIESSLQIINRTDNKWVSEWVANRMVAGTLSDSWIKFVTCSSTQLMQDLLKRIGTEVLEYGVNAGIATVLIAVADAKIAGEVFCRLKAFSSATLNDKDSTIMRQLKDLFRGLPPNIAVEGMLNSLSGSFNPREHSVAVELLGSIGDTGADLKSQLSGDLRKPLRLFLKEGLSSVLQEDDFSGCKKSALATAIARVGEPEDMADLKVLIDADIKRVRVGREELRKGNRDARTNGATMGYAYWHVRAVECLDPKGAEDALLTVLSEEEYEQEAARSLMRLALKDQPMASRVLNGTDYQALWDARSGKQNICFFEEKRRQSVNAIKERIANIREQLLKSDKPDSLTVRLKGLASTLAILDSKDSAGLVTEIMSIPSQWDGHTRVEALKVLLLNGVAIKGDLALNMLNPVIDIILKSRGANEQDRYLLQHCLCLLPFIDPPSAGIARIREVLATTSISIYDFREVIAALGNSRCDEALDLLIEIHSKYRAHLSYFLGEWIDAIAAVGTHKARLILLSFVDPDIAVFKDHQGFDYHERERWAFHVSKIVEDDASIKHRIYELCNTEGHPSRRLLLADLVSRLGTSEALVAGTNLIHDRLTPSIPYELIRGLEAALLGRKPYNGTNAYTIEPITGNEIRSCLFDFALKDKARQRSSWSLLGQIEAWRLDYGRPFNEPRHPDFDFGNPWPVPH